MPSAMSGIEETWRLWCKFQDDYSRFEDWLKAAERTAANPATTDVLYTSAKEELKKFEVRNNTHTPTHIHHTRTHTHTHTTDVLYTTAKEELKKFEVRNNTHTHSSLYQRLFPVSSSA